MRPLIDKLVRIALALVFCWLLGYVLWSAVEKRLSWPELVAGTVGTLALGACVVVWRRARKNKTLVYLFIGIGWASWSAAAWLHNRDSMAATLGAVLSAFSLWLSWMFWNIGEPASDAADE